MSTLTEIIKWAAIVFIAGFIGYFGKHLGKIIILKFRKEEPKRSLSKYEYKLEKKRLKSEKKRLKAKKKE